MADLLVRGAFEDCKLQLIITLFGEADDGKGFHEWLNKRVQTQRSLREPPRGVGLHRIMRAKGIVFDDELRRINYEIIKFNLSRQSEFTFWSSGYEGELCLNCFY